MDALDKDSGNTSEEDFANLDSSSESSNEDIEDSSSEDSDDEPRGNSKNTKKKKKIVNKKARKPAKTRIIMNVSDTQYDVVRYVGKKIFNWKLSYNGDSTDWDMFWTDNAVQPETLARMQTYQKINHFPGMYSLARKNHLGRNLMRMKKAFPENYKFFPQTFLLPSEYGEFKMQFNDKKKKTFIAKPEASCQGRGIFLTRTYESIQPGEHFVVQRYLDKPLLIDKLKFDMRIYVLIAGCDPLKIFLFDDGLARFCTEEYIAPTGENLDNVCMHLTNYAINKDSPNFVFNESATDDDVGHKRSLKAVFRLLEKEGHDIKALWKEIRKIIIKTFCSVQPILAHTYRSCQSEEPYNNMCFELLGFDIMLDHKLKPWLIEVNHTPSFTTDTPLDKSVKKHAIKDALRLMNISVENKIQAKNKKRIELQQRVLTGKKVKISPEEKQIAFENAQKERDEWEKKNHGRYTKIYPFDDPSEQEENYEEFMKEANKWWEEWTGISVRRNNKKTVDLNKPPPMVFGQGSSTSAARAKELQSSYLQKLKTNPTQKPAANTVPAKPNRSIVIPENPDAVAAPALENEEKIQEEDDEKKLENYSMENDNQDFMNHIAALHGTHSSSVIPEDSEDDIIEQAKMRNTFQQTRSYNPNQGRNDLIRIEEDNDEADELLEQNLPNSRKGSDDMEQKQFSSTMNGKGSFLRNTNFRIRTTNNFKDSQKPQQQMPSSDYRSPSEEQKLQPAAPLQNQQSYFAAAAYEKSKTLEVEPSKPSKYDKYENLKLLESKMEKEGYHKKVPMKLATGVVGAFARHNDQWSGGDGGVMLAIKSLDIERTVKQPGFPVNKRMSQRNDVKGKFFNRIQNSPPPGALTDKIPGNYVSPRLFQISVDVNKNQKVSRHIDGTTVILAPAPNVNNNIGSTKFRTYQRGSTPSMNYLESNMSLHKFYSFFANGQAVMK